MLHFIELIELFQDDILYILYIMNGKMHAFYHSYAINASINGLVKLS